MSSQVFWTVPLAYATVRATWEKRRSATNSKPLHSLMRSFVSSAYMSTSTVV